MREDLMNVLAFLVALSIGVGILWRPRLWDLNDQEDREDNTEE